MKRTVLVTGGSRGIGRAIVQLLKREGYTVLAPSRQELNLLNDASIEQWIAKHKRTRIDGMVNNAGINVPQWIEEMSDENIRDTMQINLVAPIKLIHGLVGGMKKRRWGRIVNISSAFGVVARGKQTLYCATKHGILGVTKALALELAPYNVLVNAVSPGFANTELVVSRNTPEKIKVFTDMVPLKRLIEPKEIAQVVLFLISDKNTSITGANYTIDGGFSIW